MPRTTYLVFTNCTDPAREDEFNRWYAHTHVPDLSKARGFVGARRFYRPDAGPGEARFLCQYEFDSDDPAESIRDLLKLALQAFADGRHIDCIEGAPAFAQGAPLLYEIDPDRLEPLETHDYPREVPADLQRAIDAQLHE